MGLIQSTWEQTAHGSALYIGVDGKQVAFYPFELKNPARVAATAAISLWEGEAGLQPKGIIARWQWRRGLRRLERQIAKEVRLHTTE